MIFLAELCSFIFHCITNCFLHFIWSFHDDELYSASKGVIDTSIGDNHSINGSNSFQGETRSLNEFEGMNCLGPGFFSPNSKKHFLVCAVDRPTNVFWRHMMGQYTIFFLFLLKKKWGKGQTRNFFVSPVVFFRNFIVRGFF